MNLDEEIAKMRQYSATGHHVASQEVAMRIAIPMADEIDRLRQLIPTCERGPKACDAEIASMKAIIAGYRADFVALREQRDEAHGRITTLIYEHGFTIESRDEYLKERDAAMARVKELEADISKHLEISAALRQRLQAFVDAVKPISDRIGRVRRGYVMAISAEEVIAFRDALRGKP